MSLKTSFCNKSLIKSDMKRYWWISALYTLAVFFSLTFNLLRMTKTEVVGPSDYTLRHSLIFESSYFTFFLSIFVPVVLGVLLFSYLQSGKAVTTMHSVPITRKAQYISHFLSGIILFSIPLAINFLLMLLFRVNSDFAELFRLSHLLDVMIIALIYSILTYSASCAVSMITGNVIAAFVFTYIFGILPVAAEAFLYMLAQVQFYGFGNIYELHLSKYLYILPYNLINTKNIVLYLVISAIFAVLGYILYKKRKLEKFGEVVAFSILRPVFIFGVGICAGAVGYTYFYGVWNLESIFWVMPFGVLGIIIAEMLVRKSFKVFSCYKKLIGYFAFVLVLFVFFRFDISGYENRVPDVNDIESVIFDDVYYGYEAYRYDINGERMYYDNVYDISITDKDLIEDITKYHKVIVSNREKPDNTEIYTINLSYKLKNGKTMSRTYEIDTDKNKDYLRPILESDEVKKARFPILRNDDAKTVAVFINDNRIEQQTTFYQDDTKMIEDLKNALVSDLKNAPYEEYIGRLYTPYVSVMFETKKPSHYKDGSKVLNEKIAADNSYYQINPSYKNTMAYLESIGFFDNLPTADDVASVIIENEGENYYEKEIGDEEQMKKIFNYCMENGNNGNDVIVNIKLKNGYTFQSSLKGDNLPDYVTP